MPSHKSAKKRVLQTKRKTLRNRVILSDLKTSIKSLQEFIGKNDKENALKRLPVVVSTIDKASSKGVIHKGQSARRVSRLVKKVNALSA